MTDEPLAAPPDVPQPGAAATALARPVLTSSRRLRTYLALDDFDRAARKSLPGMIYGFVDGGVETGSAKRAAAEAFADLALVPRTLMDVSGREQGCAVLGERYAAPFGVAPLGGAAMVAYRADLELAEAARAADIPMIMSASSLIRLEEVAAANPKAWFQAYLAGDQSRIDPMVDRVAAAGFRTLVVTADTPVPGNRENNTRAGFSMPLKITPRVALDAASSPRWLTSVVLRTLLKRGMPHFENMDAFRGPPMFSRDFVRNMNNRDQLAWRHVEAIRRRWPGKLVIKGLLSAADVSKARDCGADGVIVSNHGGRQLDYALAPIAALPDVKQAAGDMAVILDGAVRRGTDVLKALALGADLVLLGRPFLYAAYLGGAAGIAHCVQLLSQEIDRDMALLGVRSIGELSPDMVRPR